MIVNHFVRVSISNPSFKILACGSNKTFVETKTKKIQLIFNSSFEFF
jgi:hypothetical protein